MFHRTKLAISIVFLLTLAGTLYWGVVAIKDKLSARKARIEAIEHNKQEELTITLLEGWTVNNIAEYLSEKGVVKKDEFITASKKIDVTNHSLLSAIPKGKDLEGFLFPDTYRISKRSSAEIIVGKLLDNFDKKITNLLSQSLDGQGLIVIPAYENLKMGTARGPGLNLYELITLASIVEKESGSGGIEEKKIIAGIFYNRLSVGHALESDATINYVTGANRASPTNKDLETNSPYNTYRNAGLPPGPIGSPSEESIKAVLNPINTNYFYFLHSQTTGKVYYAKSFEEHVQNKFKYLK